MYIILMVFKIFSEISGMEFMLKGNECLRNSRIKIISYICINI